jgi:hypothetical protein
MEEIREEKIGEILSWLQAAARGKMARQTFKKLKSQKVRLVIETQIIWKKRYSIASFISVGSLLHPKNNKELHDWKNLVMVSCTLYEKQS